MFLLNFKSFRVKFENTGCICWLVEPVKMQYCYIKSQSLAINCQLKISCTVTSKYSTQMQQLSKCTVLLYSSTADNKTSLISLQAVIIISMRFPACSYEHQFCDIWRCFLPQPHLTVCTDDITQLTATRFPKGPPLQWNMSSDHVTRLNPNIVHCW